MKTTRTQNLLAAALIGAALFGAIAPAHAQDKKPNILIIWGDDIGQFNISAYNLGMMGYQTPNIDRIAHEGAIFTDWYGQQSCTAGRSAFITGQSPIRTGLTKVGLSGAPEGLQKEDPTIADLLKPLGYACGQFGKNHLGDRNEFLPTVHGFDEFLGNLYHLNTHEEPENADYPTNAEFIAKFGPRGVIHSFASSTYDPAIDPRFGVVGKQTIEDTGPLNLKRMETVDEEITDRAIKFMDQSHADGKPFFVWWNSSRMHIWTHLKKESIGKTGHGVYADGMAEHDGMVGQLLDKLKELGIEDNTIVMYSSDNGAEVFSWPDGGTTPFRNEKATNWEGGYRVPCLIRWPGVINPGMVVNDTMSHEDMVPTLLAAVGESNIAETLAKGATIGDKTYKVHIDGYNMLPYWKGEAGRSPRREFFYWTDDGDLCGLRYGPWKIVFMEQRAHGFDVWQEPFTTLRLPKLFNLLSDPFERADHEAIGYPQWRIDRAFAMVPALAFVSQHLATYREFPPRQKVGTFNLDQVLKKLQEGGASGD
jgi:arylsulfatase